MSPIATVIEHGWSVYFRLWDLGDLLEEVAVSDKGSNLFQTQDKAAVIGLSSYGKDLWFFDLGAVLG